MHSPIIAYFTPSPYGRVEFSADVMTANRQSLKSIRFKLDTGSDFTTLSYKDLKKLGYTDEYLNSCKRHGNDAVTVFGSSPLRYIENVSIKFHDREIQHCRVFFALGTKMRSFFGADILKYFNYEISNDVGELRLYKAENTPVLVSGEKRVQIYAITAESGGI